jgi:cytoskeletal protein CcmA (bactofilin family)
MALFGGSDKQPAAPASPSARTNSPVATGLSIIGLGMTVHGDIETAGVVKIEGVVYGHVTAGQQVLVAKGGLIDGGVDTGEAILGGTIHGAVSAALRVEIQSGAVVHGDVTTKRIAVADGAVLDGAIRMSDIEELAKAGPPRQAMHPTPRISTPMARPTIPPEAVSDH